MRVEEFEQLMELAEAVAEGARSRQAESAADAAAQAEGRTVVVEE